MSDTAKDMGILVLRHPTEDVETTEVDAVVRHIAALGHPGAAGQKDPYVLIPPVNSQDPSPYLGGYFAQVRRARLLSVIVFLSGHALGW